MMRVSLKPIQTRRFGGMNLQSLILPLLFRIHPVEAFCGETILETA